MANKKITDLQLISAVDDDVYFAGDDGVQTYRASALQLKNYMQPDEFVTSAKLAPAVMQYPCNGRLTLATATPVTTSDQTAKTTLYFSQYGGDKISLYNGTKWVSYAFTERSIAVPATTNTMYDVFMYDNSGTLTLELTAWTNDTTRATALTTQNGVLVKSGSLSRRYLGSFRTTGNSGETEDSAAKRFVWNYYNRTNRLMKVYEATNTWTYSTASFRQANGSAANQLAFVIGVAEDSVVANASLAGVDTAGAVAIICGIGLDSTTVNSGITGWSNFNNTSQTMVLHSHWTAIPAAGYHYLAWLEYSAGGATTMIGDNGTPTTFQNGIQGMVRG